MSSFGKTWYEIASEIIRAVQEGISVDGLDDFQRMARAEAGKGLRDRQRVLKTLLDTGVVAPVNGRYVLDLSSIPIWLVEGLSSGEVDAWSLMDQIDPTGTLARKFDDSNLHAIGERGELAVVNYLMSTTPNHLLGFIRRVSELDDSLGYDIVAPLNENGDELQLEVKTSTRPPGDRFAFFLSRNEAEKAIDLDAWNLIAVQLVNNATTILGSIPGRALSQYLPSDQNPSSKWQSVKIELPTNSFEREFPERYFN